MNQHRPLGYVVEMTLQHYKAKFNHYEWEYLERCFGRKIITVTDFIKALQCHTSLVDLAKTKNLPIKKMDDQNQNQGNASQGGDQAQDQNNNQAANSAQQSGTGEANANANGPTTPPPDAAGETTAPGNGGAQPGNATSNNQAGNNSEAGTAGNGTAGTATAATAAVEDPMPEGVTRPKFGDTVNYVFENASERDRFGGQRRMALTVDYANNNGSSRITVTGTRDGSTFRKSAIYNESEAPGTWHWPK